MMKLIKTAVATMIATIVATTPAYSFGLGDVTRHLQPDIEASFLKEKRRTIAPFAHVMFCVKSPNECATSTGPDTVELSYVRRRELVAVNRGVNREIVPVNDSGNDTWSLAPKAGDCEDFAITKRHDLISRGWPAAALRLAVAYTSWGEGHLVLVVRTTKGDLVLDNLTGAVRRWNKSGLRWQMIQSSENPRIWYTL
jgi:predicted transglutaminase-like cysteine proteinase